METENETVGMEDVNIEPESTEQPESTPAAEPVVEAEPTETPEPTDAELAAAALEETEEPEPKADPKDAVIGGMRRRIRDAERRADHAEGQLEAQTAPPVPEKSPIELEAERQEKTIDELLIDGALLKKQQAWDRQQNDLATQRQNVDTFNKAATDARRTMTDDVHGEGLGLESLSDLGDHLLDDLDRIRIFRTGKDCGKKARSVLQLRILEAGGDAAKELKQRIKTHKDSQVKPKDKQGEPEQKKKTEVPSAEVVVESDAFLESIFPGL